MRSKNGPSAAQACRTRFSPRDVDRLGAAIVAELSDDLRKPEYRGHRNRLKGHCYVASEALFHLIGGHSSGATPMNVKHEGDQHWFLRLGDGNTVDLTAQQFREPVPYEDARGRGFLTSEPSKRAAELIERVLARLARP